MVFHKGLIKGAYQLSIGAIIVPNENFNKKENKTGETVRGD